LRKSLIWLFALSFSASALLAAADADFYGDAFRRGVAAFEAGTYEVALTRLRIAAFGAVDDLPRFEAAQAYIAVAAQRLDRTDEARAALRRIAAAERVERHFASLQISDALRSAVTDAAKALLTPPQAALLTMPPAEPQISATTPTPPPTTATTDVPDPLAEADRTLASGDVAHARSAYAAILTAPELPHATLLRAGEGLTRTRDFRAAVGAFERAGAFAKGEELYRYYYAVALYESGRYADAKRELAAALPFIQTTPDVERYRGKIEHALD